MPAAVTVDPPRKGLEPSLLHYLASSSPPTLTRLLYLSCGFPALTRDTAALLGGGRWRLASAQAYLFFPGADHIETLAVFERVAWEGAGSGAEQAAEAAGV